MAIFAGESPLMLSGDSKKDLELIRNYIYERDMELRHILSHLDSSNFVDGFIDTLKPVVVETNGGTGYTVASDALSALGGQSNMSFATASTVTTDLAGNSDIPLQTYEEKDSLGVFSNGRYSSSYGYGIKSSKAGKYLISAQLNGVLSADQTSRGTISVAVRKVVNGTSSYIARGQVMFVENSRSGLVLPISIPPVVVSLEANSYLSLYVAGAWKTTANGCWLTAVYLGE